MLMIYTQGSDRLRQLQNQLMGVYALIEDFAGKNDFDCLFLGNGWLQKCNWKAHSHRPDPFVLLSCAANLEAIFCKISDRKMVRGPYSTHVLPLHMTRSIWQHYANVVIEKLILECSLEGTVKKRKNSSACVDNRHNNIMRFFYVDLIPIP